MENLVGPQNEKYKTMMGNMPSMKFKLLNKTQNEFPKMDMFNAGQTGLKTNIMLPEMNNYETEIRHLNDLNHRLTEELRKCQELLSMRTPGLEDIKKIFPQGINKSQDEWETWVENVGNSTYFLFPLLKSYDNQIDNLTNYSIKCEQENQRLNEENSKLKNENKKLLKDMEVAKLELNKFLEAHQKYNPDDPSQLSYNQLQERLVSLNEENQILLEQLALFKSSYEDYMNVNKAKIEEAQTHINQFNEIMTSLEELKGHNIHLQKENNYLKAKLKELTEQEGTLQERYRIKDSELNRLKKELVVANERLNFYKSEYDSHEKNSSNELAVINHECEALKSDNDKLKSLNESVEIRLTTEARKMKELLNELTLVKTENSKLIRNGSEMEKKYYELKEKEEELKKNQAFVSQHYDEINLEKEKLRLEEQKLSRKMDEMKDQNNESMQLKCDFYEKRIKGINDKFTKILKEKDLFIQNLHNEVEELNSQLMILKKI